MTKKELTMRELKGETRFCSDCKHAALIRVHKGDRTWWGPYPKVMTCTHPCTLGMVTGQPTVSCSLMRVDGDHGFGVLNCISNDSPNRMTFSLCTTAGKHWEPKCP